MLIELPPPTDIQVVDIVVPDNKRPGDEVTISWTVQNTSDIVASGRWTDALYLSRAATWDVGDKLLGRKDLRGVLNPTATYKLTLTPPPPGASPDDLRWL